MNEVSRPIHRELGEAQSFFGLLAIADVPSKAEAELLTTRLHIVGAYLNRKELAVPSPVHTLKGHM